VAVKQVAAGLRNILTLTEIHNSSPASLYHPTNQSSPQPHQPNHQEDTISLSSLLILATSHNTEIRASATRILCTRFYASHAARKVLLRDLKSTNDDVKRKAQLALEMLCELGVWKEGEVAMMGGGIGRWRVVERREREQMDEGARSVREDLRRRRREAVVIHDGEGAIGSEDVYMRGGGEDDGLMEDLHRDAVAIADVGIPFDRMAAWTTMAAEDMGA